MSTDYASQRPSLPKSSSSDCVNSSGFPILGGQSDKIASEETAVGSDVPNGANLTSPMIRDGSITDAMRERPAGIKGISRYSLGLDSSGSVSIHTSGENNRILSLGDACQDELGVIQGIVVRTLQGNIVVEPKSIENLLVALFEFRRILRGTSRAPYDCLWVKYVFELRDRLPVDQYKKFCKFFGSPGVAFSLLGLEDGEILPPKGLKTRASFTYSPLSSGEIRILIVLPSLDTTAMVECVLCHHALGQPPSYDALSYVWGEASKTRTIKINGQDFNATENLEIALRTLRYATPGRFRVLWVDAICIDQNNIDERNEQVRHMHKVYSSAYWVVIWLGEEKPSDRLAIEFFYQLPKLLLGSFTIHDMNGKEISDLGSTQNAIQNPAIFHKWIALSHFFTRPWWTRVWVLQEVVLAREAILYCGGLFVDWKVIRESCRIIGENMLQLSSILEYPETHQIVRMVLALSRKVMEIELMKIRGFYYGDSPRCLLRLLSRARHSRATDPRDYVYGILALLRSDKLIIPDYSLSVTETFARTAMLHMKQSRTLDVLSYVSQSCAGPKKLLYLPSWVPDWSSDHTVKWFGCMETVKHGPLYNACWVRESPVPFLFFHESLREVGLHGFMVDVIEEIGMPSNEDTIANSVQHWKLSISKSAGQSYFGLHSTLEAFWRTVFGDVLTEGHFIGRLGSDFSAIVKLPPSGEQEKLLYSYLDTVIRVGISPITKKRFFRTRIGRMGLGSVDIKPGDIVVVLLGGCVPFILREAFDGRYFLVSDSYVHGIMDGEIVKEWKDSKRVLGLFTLV